MTEQNDAAQSAPDGDAFVSRLRLIEDQPLADRAEAYVHVHDELREALDAADRQRAR